MSVTSKWFDDLRAPDVKPAASRMRRVRYSRHHGCSGSTPSQDMVEEFIKARLAEGCSPSIEDIRQHMQWQKRDSVKACLRKMAERGVLPRAFGRAELMGGRK